MNELKRLQKLLSEGKISKADYKTQLKDLLDDEEISQDEHDEAEDYEPDSAAEKPIYTQADFDNALVRKARQLVKKTLKDAGVDLTGVGNKELLETVGTLSLAGQKKGNLNVDEKELADLQRKAKAYDEVAGETKTLILENAVLKAADKHKAVNPKQVVRALSDYEDFLEFDDNDKIDPKSVEKAMGKLAEAEPNLFQAKDQNNDEDDLEEGGTGDDPTKFGGKGPGGGTGGGKKKKHEQRKNEMREMLGLGNKDQ